MNTDLITRAVVGEARSVTLGRLVGQQLERPSGTALRWCGGRWLDEPQPRVPWPAGRLPRRKTQASAVPAMGPKSQLRRGRGIALFAACTVLVVAGLAVASPALRGQWVDRGELPVAALSRVRVLHSTYAPPAAAPEAATGGSVMLAQDAKASAATLPLPFAKPAELPAVRRQGVSALASPRPVVHPVQPVASLVRQAPAVPSTPASAQHALDVPAVVLDEAAPRSVRSPELANPPETARARPSRPSSATPLAATAAASYPAAARPSPAAAQLIAITPDGKSAVFTDPQTRLPRQFQLGEQLPEGDVIRSIDAGAGRVHSSTREYSLE